MGLGEISTKQAVDDFLLGSIQTKVWVCNQLVYQTNPCDVYLFHLLILYYFSNYYYVKVSFRCYS